MGEFRPGVLEFRIGRYAIFLSLAVKPAAGRSFAPLGRWDTCPYVVRGGKFCDVGASVPLVR